MLIYRAIILVTTFFIWLFLSASRYAKYDDNYALAGIALLISISTIVSIALYCYFNWRIVKANMNLTILFIATSSPISLYMFIYSFEEVFEQFFYYPT